MSGENLSRPSRRGFTGPCMAHTNMVPSSSTDADSATQVVVVDPSSGVIETPIRQGPQHARQTEVDGLSIVRQHYQSQGFSDHVTGVLLDSWRTSTQKQYASYLKKWNLFCRERKILAHSPTLNQVLEFLYTQLHLSYSSINSARSALSCFIYIDNFPVGKHPIVCRFLKGAFERKPPANKHYAIWDVQTVLAYLKTFTPNSGLSLKKLSHKLTMLLALVTIQRKQTLIHLNINNGCMIQSDVQFVFVLDKHIKQSRPNYSVPPVIVPRYTLDPDVCPYLCLEEYLEKTKHLRQSDNLLVATIKPHRAIGSQTLARWIKIVFAGAGIDITLFKPHSTRHAAATAAYAADLPVDEILKRAGWSNATTFRRFYYKGVIE